MITRSRSKSKSPNPPQPQATSTVQRENTLKSRFDGKSHLGEEIGRQGLSYENESPERDNSVAFESNEITACSSGISTEGQSFLHKAFHGINFSKNDIMAQFDNEMMAKINDEEFLSGSKVAEQLSIDELDRTYFIPVMNTEKQKMDFGSLSSITGEVDISIESCAGQKVSVGQYFERKSENIGILGNNEKVKPTLGGISETPIKTGNLAALVESTILSDAELTDNERPLIPDERDVEEVNMYTLTFDSNKDIVLGKNTERSCTCIVGMSNDINVELINNGDSRITCNLKLIEVRGDIELNILPETFLIEPNGTQSTKIKVKVRKMCKLMFVKLNIFLSDMVAKSKWSMKHMIFVKPEELDIWCYFGKQKMDYQYIAEEIKTYNVLPITFYNRNNVDVAVELSILHDESKLFSIDGPTHLVLKPHEKIVINIKCEKSRSTSIDSPQRQPKNWKSKLFVHVECCKDNTIFHWKEVPLSAQIDAKIKLVAGNNVYHHIIRPEQNLLEREKENYLLRPTPSTVFLSPATSPQSVISNRSGPCDSPITASSIAVAENKIPIRATHAALVWNSIKTRNSEMKEFAIRNMSNNNIEIQLDIYGDNKSFKFVGDKQTASTSMVLAMQRQESKTLAIAFSPYSVGPVAGKITIKRYTRESCDNQQHKKIPLYGYGGCSEVKITGTFKDLSGKMWLSLGTLYSETTILSANIALNNIGDLCSFAKIRVVPKAIYPPTMDSRWHVNPKEVILRSYQQVTIEFYPKKEDFALLQGSEVFHVATIYVTHGDEPIRWRIRRLYNKIKESGESTGNENEEFKKIIDPICKTFPGEQEIPDLRSLCDPIENLGDLCTGVHQYEIMLTVETCADDTLSESEMYKSLMSDTSDRSLMSDTSDRSLMSDLQID